jgi:hypothetical protein
VLRALEEGYLDSAGADIATIDHYDEDGVVALGLLLVPSLSDKHAHVLVEAARVGDFGVVRDRRAALIAFALSTLGDPQRSPVELSTSGRGGRHLQRCASAASEALGLLEQLAADTSPFESLWHEEAAAFDAATAGVGRWVHIEEVAENDLAIVRVQSEEPSARWGDHVVHPASVYSSTQRMRVATISADRLELRFRYESWVRMASSRPRLRVDLTSLAADLESLEPSNVKWTFDGANATRPVLKTSGWVRSGISPDLFVERVIAHLSALDDKQPAWDPYVESVS